jgi:Fe-S oxidoreductase
VRRVRALYVRERDELERRIPQVLRHVAGYNLHRVGVDGHNMAEFVIGSEGTLGFFTELELQLAPLPISRVLGVCHFPTLHAAMDATQHIVELSPTAVELVDSTLIGLARRNPMFATSTQRFVRGDPGALLLVEFSGADRGETRRGLDQLEDLVAELGFSDSVVRAEDGEFQQAIWGVRKAGMNIIMSTKGARKPIAFIEDCAVPLEHLAEYTDRLSAVFAEHGTGSIWYAHASVGCLHVRPALNLKDPDDVATMRSIAEQTHAIVAEYKGSHSGEHGDGIVRSEFLKPMLGDRLVRAFEEIKRLFDPNGLFNPGKIVDAPRMDDRSLFRYRPHDTTHDEATVLDWSPWGGLTGAVEMCNNNGACRKRALGAMCPSFRATNDERDVTRGRANALRLALTGRMGDGGMTSDAVYETMDLCIGCKACRSECPTGVDMARMKIEVLQARARAHGVAVRERVVANLPRYAPLASKFSGLANLSQTMPGSAWATGRLGFTSKRSLPVWHRNPFGPDDASGGEGAHVVLFADTFNAYFEPDNLRAAVHVLETAGYRVIVPTAVTGRKNLCCGRTFLSAGLVDEARFEMRRVIDALVPLIDRGAKVVGLEPSCLLTFRDELPVLLPGDAANRLAGAAFLFEEFLAYERGQGRFEVEWHSVPTERVLVHGHCHQKALGAASSISTVLGWIPGLAVDTIDGTCCGMAGAFGYEKEHYDVSMAIGELDVLPAVRSADASTWVVADGTSCREQVAHGSGREAVHVVRVLERAMDGQRLTADGRQTTDDRRLTIND